MDKPKVAFVLGSRSDYNIIEPGLKLLDELKVPYEVTVSSAHRSPDRTHRYAVTLEERGFQVIVACAGGAAHLAGVLAAHTILPVVGVPIASSPLQGLDSLLATSMMPAGVPVATMAIGSAGASNAAILAAQILARSDPALAQRLRDYKKSLADRVEEGDREVKKKSRD